MNQMTTTTNPGSIGSLSAESGLSIQVPGDVRSEEATQEIYRDGVTHRGTNNILNESRACLEEIFTKSMRKAMEKVRSEEICRDLGDPTDNHVVEGYSIDNVAVDIPSPFYGVTHRGLSNILKKSLAVIGEKLAKFMGKVAKFMICTGKKVDTPILMGMIAVALADLATTETATTVSWFDKAKPILYCLLCASQVSVMVLRPAKNTTPCSAATSSPAPVNANAEKLGDLIAGGTLLCSAVSLFCRCVAGIPPTYAVPVVTVCTAHVLGCALFAFYSNPN